VEEIGKEKAWPNSFSAGGGKGKKLGDNNLLS